MDADELVCPEAKLSALGRRIGIFLMENKGRKIFKNSAKRREFFSD